MIETLFTISFVLILFVNLIRLLFRSQRPSAKKWLKLSGAAFIVCIVAVGFVAKRDRDREAVALGFVDSSDRREAKAQGIEDPAAWRIRKAKLEAAEAKEREEAERKAAAAKKLEDAKAKAAAAKKAADEKLAAWKEQNCDKDLECIGKKKIVVANARCSMAVELLAKYQSEWTDGFGERKFPYYRWGSRDGVVTYYGAAVKFQNGFGAWQNMIYECDFDIRRDAPIDARAQAGRLP